MKIKNDRRASVTIVFESPAGALGWFEKAQDAGLLQPTAALFERDSLDGHGVPAPNELIVRSEQATRHARIDWAPTSHRDADRPQVASYDPEGKVRS